MVPHTTRLPVSDPFADPWLIQAVVQLSSSPAASQAAAAWLATYDAALAAGSSKDEACVRADDAYHLAAEKVGLVSVARYEEARAA